MFSTCSTFPMIQLQVWLWGWATRAPHLKVGYVRPARQGSRIHFPLRLPESTPPSCLSPSQSPKSRFHLMEVQFEVDKRKNPLVVYGPSHESPRLAAVFPIMQKNRGSRCRLGTPLLPPQSACRPPDIPQKRSLAAPDS
ncbi:hypothetical protein B0T21DRAFT_354119 [Apiosordaria backusii]|uniref:Uncharacterized protein n=1 Tax=Apiosordaria backusii TaxID=314023 RepID=A0AA40EXG9_9PEZI|nr:hypothetical protein B0T21DRAFT_354119 [Apiosordaria backusii]